MRKPATRQLPAVLLYLILRRLMPMCVRANTVAVFRMAPAGSALRSRSKGAAGVAGAAGRTAAQPRAKAPHSRVVRSKRKRKRRETWEEHPKMRAHRRVRTDRPIPCVSPAGILEKQTAPRASPASPAAYKKHHIKSLGASEPAPDPALGLARRVSCEARPVDQSARAAHHTLAPHLVVHI